MTEDTITPITPSVSDVTTPASVSASDFIAQTAMDPEQEARMRAVWDHVGAHIWQLLFIARNQNVQKLATITNHGSLEARRCKQFIFSADVVLGIYALPTNHAA